jgi:hypothetical protein
MLRPKTFGSSSGYSFVHKESVNGLSLLVNRHLQVLNGPMMARMLSAETCDLYSSNLSLYQGYTNPRCQVAMATKCFTVAPNICGSSIWNSLHVAIPTSGVWRWLLGFWETYAHLIYVLVSMPEIQRCIRTRHLPTVVDKRRSYSCDVWCLILRHESTLKGRRLQKNVSAVLKVVWKGQFHRCFRRWYHRQVECVPAEEHCSDGDTFGPSGHYMYRYV